MHPHKEAGKGTSLCLVVRWALSLWFGGDLCGAQILLNQLKARDSNKKIGTLAYEHQPLCVMVCKTTLNLHDVFCYHRMIPS